MKAKFKMSELMKNITMDVKVEITGMRIFAVRRWIATQMLKLSAWILGCQIKIEVSNTPISKGVSNGD